MIKQYSFICLLLLSAVCVVAQEGAEWKTPSKESLAYHDYRTVNTTPPYSLKKVKALAAQSKTDNEDNKKINAKDYQSLSLREKFTYHMVHAESYSQNCDAMPPIQDEQTKIFARLPDAFDEYTWSDRQKKFFTTNRDSVLALVKECIATTKRIGVNLKLVIQEVNGRELVPLLISTYNIAKKDHDILTLLMLLMKDNEYIPFLQSIFYKKLYGDEANYSAFINFNTANEELIIKRATDFYNGLGK